MSTQFSAIGLISTDLAATLDFYRLLGLDLPPGAENGPHAEATLPGGLRLMFDPVETIRSFDPDWAPPTGSARMSLAFACTDPAEVDEAYGRLTGAGHRSHHEPWDTPWGQRYATVLDPDGNPVDLFAPLP